MNVHDKKGVTNLWGRKQNPTKALGQNWGNFGGRMEQYIPSIQKRRSNKASASLKFSLENSNYFLRQYSAI
ncbi:hypothetical protein, partial [Vibrio sagamiensis]|uniref:hypothetical protein n=1 Tax=Vibrio sagamiensis TaxID=512650 RepID=UPI001C98FCEB